MASQLISLHDKCCAVCFHRVSLSDKTACVVQPHEDDPKALHTFSIMPTSHRRCFVAHRSCYLFVKSRTPEADLPSLSDRIILLATTLGFLWPPTHSMESQRIERMSGACFVQITNGMDNDHLFPRLLSLPAELRDTIIKLASPSPFTQICTLVAASQALPTISSPREVSVGAWDWQTANSQSGRAHLLGKQYLLPALATEVQESETIIQTYDNVTCIGLTASTGLNAPRRSCPEVWYRRATTGVDSSVAFKVGKHITATFRCRV